jgi:hypothetical protein
MHLLATNVLAFGWEPEIKGITVVLIGVVVLIGSTYLILGTNVGSRLGFLVSMAALFGWMFTMGAIWWAYGIGLQGTAASWVGQEIVPDGDLSNTASDVIRGIDLSGVTTENRVDGWILLEEDDPRRGQAVASAEALLIEEGTFSAGDFLPEAVYDYGGERLPNWTFDTPWGTWNIDYLAFIHQPHFSLVQVRPVVPAEAEPGKAPPTPQADPDQPATYVLMERDRGTRRWPAAFITIGSGIIFALLCWALHARDRRVVANRSQALEQPAKVPVGV